MDKPDKLLQSYFDGELMPEQEQELQDWLRADPDHVRTFVSQAHLHHGIREILKADAELRAVAPSKSRLTFARWLIPLAAAATVLATIGTLYWTLIRGPAVPEYAMGRLTHSIGPLNIVDISSSTARITTVETTSDSLCRLDQPDGTVIAVDRNSVLRWNEDRASGAKTLDVNAGQAYLDVAVQKQPFLVRFPLGAQAEVLGTRFVANRSGPMDYISVLKGHVRVQNGPTALYVAAGQTASPRATGPGGYITLAQGPTRPKVLSWIDRVGIDSAHVRGEAPQEVIKYLSQLDLSLATIHSGTWRLERQGDDVMATQEDPDGPGRVLFGHFEWLKGEFSCKVRVSKLTQDPALEARQAINVAFAYADGGMDLLGIGGRLAPMVAVNPLLNMQADFEVDQKGNTLNVRRLEVWPEGHREAGWRRDNWLRTPQETQALKSRGPCSLGINVSACSAEFFDLRLTNAVSANEMSIQDLRASMGMIARYDFQDIKGQTVADSSDVAPAMDLAIGKPDLVDRLASGLRVHGAADIATHGDLPKLRDAWKTNNGISLEFFIRRDETPGSNPRAVRRIFRLSAGDGSDSYGHDVPRAEPDPARIYHCISVWQDRDGALSQDYYVDGKPTAPTLTGDIPWELHKRPSPIALNMAPSRQPPGKSTQPWHGELLFTAVYDHALQPDEIARLFQAGLPAADGGRAPLGLIARYDFQGIKGRTVPDSSGVTPSMDLAIGKPDLVDRLTIGLRLRGASDIAARGDLQKLRDAWGRNHGLSLEFYLVPKALPEGNVKPRRLFSLTAGPGGGGWWQHDFSRGQPIPDSICHYVVILRDRNGRFMQDLYVNGRPSPSGVAGTVAWDLDRQPGPFELNLAPSRVNPDAPPAQPWQGEMIFMAIYDRALQPDEVTRLYRSGVWPWVAEYYSRHSQFILQREKFSAGPVRQVISPEDLLKSFTANGDTARVIKQHAMPGKKTGDVLSVVNTGLVYSVTQPAIAGGLPNAFVVEFDLMPVRTILPPGETAVINCLQFDHIDTTLDSLSLAGLPDFCRVQDMSVPAPMLGRWTRVRAAFFRVGTTRAGEPLYEMQFGTLAESGGVALSRKPGASISLSFRESEQLIGGLTISELKPVTVPETSADR